MRKIQNVIQTVAGVGLVGRVVIKTNLKEEACGIWIGFVCSALVCGCCTPDKHFNVCDELMELTKAIKFGDQIKILCVDRTVTGTDKPTCTGNV